MDFFEARVTIARNIWQKKRHREASGNFHYLRPAELALS